MCFGGGGGQQQAAAPNINVTPQTPTVVKPEAPKQLANTYQPIQSQQYQPGFQQAGSTKRRQDLASGRIAMANRRGLSIGVSGSAANFPTGGINL